MGYQMGAYIAPVETALDCPMMMEGVNVFDPTLTTLSLPFTEAYAPSVGSLASLTGLPGTEYRLHYRLE